MEALRNPAPVYIKDLIPPYEPAQQLRSPDIGLLIVPIVT